MAQPPDLNDSALHAELESLGFEAVQADRKGVVQYARRPNRFLTQWVHDDSHELLFTWEFDLGEFCESVGWQIGAAETSFQILFPQFDVRIARDLEAVAIEVQRLEDQLRGLDLSDPSL
ncbi:MAG TPA: hypothetical protein VMM13_02950 [Euzebya sp.]|nr:hypothetical protein [Euzebya sp.]